MKENHIFNSSRGAVFLLYSHMVFVTKYRKSLFTKDHLVEMKAIFDSVCKELGVCLEEFDGEETTPALNPALKTQKTLVK